MQIQVFVQPWAKQDRVEKQQDLLGNDVYKLWTRAKPIDGQANEAVLELLAKHFQIKKYKLKLLMGAQTRMKIFEIQK